MYFSDIDTTPKAYIFGFIIADGYVSKKRNVVAIELSHKDVDVLNKIKSFMDVNNNIAHRPRGGYDYVRLSICNSQIHDDLISHGCTPRKTFNVRPKYFDSIKLQNAYLRGYFDGDGSIYTRPNGSWRISVRGTKEMLLCYKDTYDIPSSIYTGGAVGELQSENQSVIKNMITSMYQGAQIYLDRKYNLAKQII